MNLENGDKGGSRGGKKGRGDIDIVLICEVLKYEH